MCSIVKITSRNTVLSPWHSHAPIRCGAPAQLQKARHLKKTAANAVDVAVAEKRTVPEVTAETMPSFLEENASGLTVIDFYTTWCGPCKVMGPVVEKLSREFRSVAFAKFNCADGDNGNNKFAVQCGIKALPTFVLYRDSQKVGEVTGAKAMQLRRLVAQHLSKQSS